MLESASQATQNGWDAYAQCGGNQRTMELLDESECIQRWIRRRRLVAWRA